MSDTLSWFPNKGNKNTKQEFNNIMEIMSEINDIDESNVFISPVNLKTINKYQQRNLTQWLDIKQVDTKEVIFVEEVIII